MLGPLEDYLRQFQFLLPFMPLIVVLLRVASMLGAALLAMRLGTALITKLFSGTDTGLKLDKRKAKT